MQAINSALLQLLSTVTRRFHSIARDVAELRFHRRRHIGLSSAFSDSSEKGGRLSALCEHVDIILVCETRPGRQGARLRHLLRAWRRRRPGRMELSGLEHEIPLVG